MSRFWMVQQILAWLGLAYNVATHGSWWTFAFAAAGFVWFGLNFAKAAERDDRRQSAAVVVINGARQP